MTLKCFCSCGLSATLQKAASITGFPSSEKTAEWVGCSCGLPCKVYRASRGLDSLQHTSAPSRQGMVKFKYLGLHALGKNKYLGILILSLVHLLSHADTFAVQL